MLYKANPHTIGHDLFSCYFHGTKHANSRLVTVVLIIMRALRVLIRKKMCQLFNWCDDSISLSNNDDIIGDD